MAAFKGTFLHCSIKVPKVLQKYTKVPQFYSTLAAPLPPEAYVANSVSNVAAWIRYRPMDRRTDGRLQCSSVATAFIPPQFN